MIEVKGSVLPGSTISSDGVEGDKELSGDGDEGELGRLAGLAALSGEAIATGAIQDAADFVGVGDGITFFELGQQQADLGDSIAALDFFELAYVAGLTARLDAIPGPTTLLPFQVVLGASFISTRQDRAFNVLAVAPGGAAPGSLNVANAPPAMGVSVAHPDPALPVFNVGIDTTGVPLAPTS